MTRTEHLLCILQEECNEVAHRASKALRFSLTEVQPGQELDNGQRILEEYADLVAVMQIICAEHLVNVTPKGFSDMILAKIEKVEKFLVLSKENGTLQ